MSESFYTDKHAVKLAFDRAAGSYDAAAVLQREVADRMAERLDYIKLVPGRILDAGSGTGYASPMLRARYPEAQLVELDLAPAMLALSRDKGSGRGVRKWLNLFERHKPFHVCGDIERLPLADESVDLVWSNLTLQWCNTPDAALAECHRVLRPGGLLMFSTLGPDTLKELRAAFEGVDRHSHVNRFIDMHDVGDALGRAGLTTPVMDMELITMTYPDARSVMRDLKAIGAHNVTEGRPEGMMGKRAWRKVVEQYERFRHAGELPCTYEVVYGHAWKPENRANARLPDGSQVIEFRRRPGT
ncbi:malonyl-[acyl-carrier protein] O-methyltransferase 1 [Chitiniphilus shinanonensis]|uniref:Malonyl-[acyl-carrier protein] O-methyltransferase n=1 Tax=Chitiniphilus shinanonensis TaxID=553088 RepID=A0ABQ6BSU5_9NEIS|nr:malonyl-ACP O-methyltransferase BioC [Chitiniphilus shinanonensis]GLS04512.1 malonyl-[acyl-carrier protein] O-methyltransferase 1 [Chitiniphilus shinanonensis]